MIIIAIITRGKKMDASGRKRRRRVTWLMIVAASCLGNLFLFFFSLLFLLILFILSLFILGAPVMRRANVAPPPPAPPLPADGVRDSSLASQPGLTIKTWATVARG